MATSYKQLMNNITTFIFDVDGVLTDGTIMVTTDGEMYRNMSIKDGYALKAAVVAGYNVCIISGGSNEGVRKRLQGLGITDIYLGAHQKILQYEEYCSKKNITPEQVLYMGDDIPDIPVMQQVALATCPQDAAPEVKDVSEYVSPINGGKGCGRDVIEQVMRVQGKWMIQFEAKYD
ncbi:MAG: 3-deoxy-D-manno-octulosonate 8-phosphate phosphatase [Kordia sp.]|nr:MAG: 3-deoxy-D-manno-octulosonate 8-phosphate phosphatase [Kordia sp.]